MTRAEKIRRAVKVLQSPRGTVQQRMSWLKDVKGLTDDELMEALNEASGGALVASALGAD